MNMRNETYEKQLSAIKGCLIGGAVGDALGYAVEFMTLESIVKKYGPGGIWEYAPQGGLARISDDTQMTMYTAQGLLNAVMDGSLTAEEHIYQAYREWYACQMELSIPETGRTPLWDITAMHSPRAPGTTCLSALGSGKMGTIEKPINNSKGCGGVMRAAPVALAARVTGNLEHVERLAAESAAITHGHPLGYSPAAVLAHIVSRAAFGGSEYAGLSGFFREWRQRRVRFPMDAEQLELLDRALMLSQNDQDDATNIEKLGQGWTGEEALAIALYCCFRHEDDFSAAVIAAVNHSGDSDSTGAIAGNIMGAYLGYGAIEEKWLRNLEMKQEILDMALKICDIGR